LTFQQKLSTAAKLDIGVVGNLKDAAGGRVASATSQAIAASPSDMTDPQIVSRSWGADQGSYTVIVEFSEAMDAGSAASISNYALAGVRPTSATLDSTGKVL